MKHSTIGNNLNPPGVLGGDAWNAPHRLIARIISADATLTADDDYIEAVGGSSGISITLLPLPPDGTTIHVMKIDSGDGVVTLLGTINGDPALFLETQWQIVILRASGGTWEIVSSLYIPFLRIFGSGKGSELGFGTLLDVETQDDGPWAVTVRNKSAASGEGFAIFVNDDGDTFLQNVAADGTVVNFIILRGLAHGNNIRFGPDSTHGVAIAPNGFLSLDGDVNINNTTGGGASFGSVGGAKILVKPENFNSPNRTHILPNADGKIVVQDLGQFPVFANNAAAISGGLTAGNFYRTGADPDPICVVH